MKWSVYIMRFPNKKKYVGVTRLLPFHIRIKQHIQSAMSGSNLTLSCAIRKYGALSIKFGVVAKCNSEKEAKHLEVEYIRELDTLRPHGYNSTVGGNGVIDPSGMSECKRVSSCKKTMATSAYKEKQRQIQKQVWNEDKCLQRSEETKQLWSNPEYRSKVTQAHIRPDAKCHIPKAYLTHEERSKIQKIALNCPGVRERMSISAKKAQSQPGMKERQRASAIKQMANPLFKKQHIVRMRKVMQDESVRAKCSESQKRRKPYVKICQKCGGQYITKAINHFNKDRCPECRDSLAISQFMSAMRQKRVA